jgi:hypothetical protein
VHHGASDEQEEQYEDVRGVNLVEVEQRGHCESFYLNLKLGG